VVGATTSKIFPVYSRFQQLKMRTKTAAAAAAAAAPCWRGVSMLENAMVRALRATSHSHA